MKKLIYVFLIFMVLIVFYKSNTYAVQNLELYIIDTIKVVGSAQQVIDSGGGSTSSGEFGVGDLNGTTSSGSDEIKDVGNNIIQILSTVASIISVLVLILLGVKYMFGSVEEKAEYKKTLMPYIIGATLVFAASGIAGIIYSIAINVFK